MFEDWDWNKLAGNVAQGAITALPAFVAGNYGARQVAGANQRAADLSAANRTANAGVITGANADAQNRLKLLSDQMEGIRTDGAGISAPAVGYLRDTVARDPYALTPEQQQSMADATRAANSQLTNFGTAGSGRATSAVINDLQNRTRQGLITKNVNRSTDAAGRLATIGGQRQSQAISGIQSAGTQGAQIAANAGPALAHENTQATTDMGNAITGTANSNAGTVGMLAGTFARAANDAGSEGRASRYGRFAAGG